MKVGEVCYIICKLEYVYGLVGSFLKIFFNVMFVFEVELFEFKGEDLMEEEDGGIICRIWICGEGYVKFNEGVIVEVVLEGYYKDQFFDQWEFCFEIGEGENLDLFYGLERVIQCMEKGEYFIVYFKFSYVFGSVGKEKF